MTDPAPDKKHVLVTGSSGNIGTAVSVGLIARGHCVLGFDRVSPPETIAGMDDFHQGDLTDRAALDKAVAGVDTIVHLAAHPNEHAFLEVLLPNNIIGPYNVLEAAREAGVGRVVLTSSIQVMMNHDWHDRTIGIDEMPRPISNYAVTKYMSEGWGWVYANRYKISTIVVRPGWVSPDEVATEDREVDLTAAMLYTSRADCTRFFIGCVETPDIDFALLYVTGRSPKHQPFDLEPARKLLGYEPKDTWPGRIKP